MHKFLAALEEAGYEREDNSAQAVLLRELVNSLSSGNLLLAPTDDVLHLDEEEREDFAIAKLDQLIELVVSIRMRGSLLLRASRRAKSRGAAWDRSKEICPNASREPPPGTFSCR